MKVLKLIFFFLSLHVSHALKILAIFPLSMHSHLRIGHSIAESLLDAGHEVTAISGLQNQKPRDNYRVIQLPDFIEKMKEAEGNPFQYVDIPIIVSILMMAPWSINTVNMIMQEAPELTEFLKKDDEKFDVCIIEVFNNEAMLGIAEKYDCILIGYSTFGAVLWVDDPFSNISPTSYVPHPFLTYADDMNFGERFYNAFISLIDWAYYKVIHFPIQRYLYSKYFPNAKRSMDEMYKNYSFIFMNQHVSFSTVRPYLPTQIEIGGIHVKPAKKLTKDFQEFLDSATDGAILFTMGSYIDGTDWKEEDRQALTRVLGKLKQKVIWKYSNETLPGNPGNIKIGSWLPQRDILAHPNVKLFITHGGLLGTTEALVEGVPVLGIPIFGDQMMNMQKSVKRGYGLQVLYAEFSEEKFSQTINEIISNPSYHETAQTVSKRFKDRPMSPQKTVAFWTEYAARHQGAKHLKSAGNELNFMQLYAYDVYGVMAVIFVIVLLVDYVILKAIIKRCFKKKKNVEKMKKN